MVLKARRYTLVVLLVICSVWLGLMYYQPHNIKHGKEFLQPSIDFDDNKRTSYLNYTYRLRNIRTRSSSIYTEQPKDTLMSFLDNLIDQNVKEKYLVCCHIRVGKNPSIPQDNAFGEFEKPNETIVFKYLKRYTDPDKYVIYLASDSLYVRSEFWKIFKNGIHIDVPIIHVDRLGTHKHNEKEACDGLKYVLIEQYLLSTCDILILTADSGFGKYAAYLRGSSDNLFLIQLNDSQVITTKLRYI
ncbi:uncharacterized protein LOC132730747 isoform X3 [Ruditapes philippinarum]|uniref:uncharacterized protein LOC132730747 isoform X3 n=1 Tax=Ruditapes philippinarum TaxID=129788 RepID=UPI00295B5660|nr:uncharacterized protein LOC132730747 isoform X3 [Ruditapes philippinarum]